MANTRKIKGFDKVKANLDKEIKAIKGRTLAGLIEAQIVVRRDMEQTSPTVPVDLRNLDHSYFAVASNGEVAAGGSASFEGEKAGELNSDHSGALARHKAIAASKGKPWVIMGFSANYAVFVHEMEGVNWSRPGSGGKFFEMALNRNTPLMLQTIAKKAKIK